MHGVAVWSGGLLRYLFDVSLDAGYAPGCPDHQDRYATGSENLIGHATIGPAADTRVAMAGHDYYISGVLFSEGGDLFSGVAEKYLSSYFKTFSLQLIGYFQKVPRSLLLFLTHRYGYLKNRLGYGQ